MEQDGGTEDRLSCLLCFLPRALLVSSFKSFDWLFTNVRNVVNIINCKSGHSNLAAVLYDIRLCLGAKCNVVLGNLEGEALLINLCTPQAALGYASFRYTTL